MVWSSRRIGSITSRNSTGERTEPWRTPRWMTKGDETVPFTRTEDFGLLYHCLISRHAFPVTPAFFRWLRRTGYSTVSVMCMRMWIRHVYCINYDTLINYHTVMGKDIDTPVRLERATRSEADTLEEECSRARLGQVERVRQTQQQASTPEWSHLLVKSSCLPPWTWAPLFPLQ